MGETADWSHAKILAALQERGHSLFRLSINHGFTANAAGKALKKPSPAMERIIAAALDLPPQAIWPDRYDDSGSPLRRRRKPRNDSPRSGHHPSASRSAANRVPRVVHLPPRSLGSLEASPPRLKLSPGFY